MYAKNFVICDSEEQYAMNLIHVLENRKEAGMQIYLFQKIEEVKAFAEQKKIDILLIGESYTYEQRSEIPAKRRFVFIKDRNTSLEREEVGIYRYQSCEMILAKISEVTVRRDGKRGSRKRVGGQLIGIYSPIHRIGKTRFALSLGKKLAEKEPVLYLNLEGYAGSAYYFAEQTDQNLADLIYYLRQEKGNLGLRISMMVEQQGKLDYIRPMPYILDMQAVSCEEWIQLLQQIFEQCIYEKIILDLGDSVNGLFEILEACHTIYTPYIEEKIAMAKLAEYTENLRKTGKEQVLERTIQKKMR